MKTALTIISFIFLAIAMAATPTGIGVAIYNFAFTEVGIGMSLWIGFKWWAIMLFSGIFIGYPLILIKELK